MNKKLYFTGVGLMFLLGACSRYATEETFILTPQKTSIALQNLKTREIVRCNADSIEVAESCAKSYEENGFVKVSDIPTQTAKYDLRKPRTYPTRRWREGEKVPRW